MLDQKMSIRLLTGSQTNAAAQAVKLAVRRFLRYPVGKPRARENLMHIPDNNDDDKAYLIQRACRHGKREWLNTS